MRMINPIFEVIEWLKKQDDDVQIDIAFIMSGVHPCFGIQNLPEATEKYPKYFYSHMENYSGTDIQNTGFILSIRAIFDFVFAKKRRTVEGWSEAKTIFESVIKNSDPDRPPSVNEHAQQMIDEITALCEKWLAICQEWNELKNTVLSDKSIEDWDSENMLERGNSNRYYGVK